MANAVGHDTTGIGHGVKTVTTAGTDERLVSVITWAKWVTIQAQTDNTGIIAVGGGTHQPHAAFSHRHTLSASIGQS